jgi:dTDP-4-dehydrorhamnose 3,5-epimerase-like enzyme
MTEKTTWSGQTFVDDRGKLTAFNTFNKWENIKRMYQVSNHEQGFVRAWHGHNIGAKYVFVSKGSAKFHIIEIKYGLSVWQTTGIITGESPKETIILSEYNPQILYIPPGYYNGFQTLTSDTVVQFFTTTTIEEDKNDNLRLAWDHFGTDLWEIKYR